MGGGPQARLVLTGFYLGLREDTGVVGEVKGVASWGVVGLDAAKERTAHGVLLEVARVEPSRGDFGLGPALHFARIHAVGGGSEQ